MTCEAKQVCGIFSKTAEVKEDQSRGQREWSEEKDAHEDAKAAKENSETAVITMAGPGAILAPGEDTLTPPARMTNSVVEPADGEIPSPRRPG